MDPTPLQIVILGAIQGFTEFLPISSSGHLVLVQELLHIQAIPVLYDIVLHGGTLTAILIYFARRFRSLDRRLVKPVIIGTFPAVVVGLFLLPIIEALFSSLYVVAIGFAVTGLFLYRAKHHPRSSHPLTPRRAVVVGLFQALAIVPGISRSGSTITSGLRQGLDRSLAFTFSFMLAIPAIIGAIVTQLPDLMTIDHTQGGVLVLGFFSAALVGLYALDLLKQVLLAGKLASFAYYCFFLSAVTLLLALT